MSKRSLTLLSAVGVLVAFLLVSTKVPQAYAQSSTPAATMAGGMTSLTKATALTITAEDGIPKGTDLKAWDKAFGVAEMLMGNAGKDTITVKAGGLVPNGLYTIWWVNMKPAMTMGPLTTPANNTFKADSNGYGTITFEVPSKNDYQVLFVVYHADGKTHGEDPGKMGSESYSHLMGEFPGPSGMAANESMGDNMAATMVPTMAK